MKNLIVSLFCLFPLVGFAQKRNKTVDRFAGLDTAFARVLKEWKAEGFAVAVVEKDKVVYAKGFGHKDREAGAPVTERTQFAIGSCTKAFTSSLIGHSPPGGKLKNTCFVSIPIEWVSTFFAGSVQLRLHRWPYRPDEVLVVGGSASLSSQYFLF